MSADVIQLEKRRADVSPSSLPTSFRLEFLRRCSTGGASSLKKAALAFLEAADTDDCAMSAHILWQEVENAEPASLTDSRLADWQDALNICGYRLPASLNDCLLTRISDALDTEVTNLSMLIGTHAPSEAQKQQAVRFANAIIQMP